jgi:hypothetical protein
VHASLTELNLADNKGIGDAGATAIAAGLARGVTACKLRTLNLWGAPGRGR